MTQHNDADAPAAVWANRSHPIEEDMQFQRAEWRVERFGWWVLGGFVVLACLGLFSVGPVSSTKAQSGTGDFEVEYDRFQRNGATATMRLRVQRAAGEETVITLDEAFMEAFTVEAIMPEPSEFLARHDGVALVFKGLEDAPLSISLSVRPSSFGLIRSDIGMAGGSPARLNTFIYP